MEVKPKKFVLEASYRALTFLVKDISSASNNIQLAKKFQYGTHTLILVY
jgi:hypothetical protein